MSGRQQWALLSLDSMAGDDWDFYSARFGGRPGVGVDLLPALGVGEVSVLVAGPDGVVRPAWAGDLELSPGPVDLLAQELGLDVPETGWAQGEEEDPERVATQRVSHVVLRALRDQVAHEPLAAGWAEALSVNGYFLWSQNAAEVLVTLIAAAHGPQPVSVHLEFRP